MKDEYIIINKTALQKRIDELEKERLLELKDDFYDALYLGEINSLKQILSQSIPLISEIKTAFDIGSLKTEECFKKHNGFIAGVIQKDKQDYILNLKLDI